MSLHGARYKELKLLMSSLGKNVSFLALLVSLAPSNRPQLALARHFAVSFFAKRNILRQ